MHADIHQQNIRMLLPVQPDGVISRLSKTHDRNLPVSFQNRF